MKKLVKFYIPAVFLGILLILIFQPNPYLRRAIIYNTADISDHEIFSNRIVNTGNTQEWGILSNYNTYSLSTEELKLIEKYRTVAFLVAKDSNLLFESYWDGYARESISNSFSVAKSIVSLLVGIAIDEGDIESLNDPISKYLPKYGNDIANEIRIKDLLTMSSGLKWNESYFNPFSVTTKAYYGNEIKDLVLKAKRINKPGVKFEYITANPQLLSMIIKEVSGKSISEYASEKLWIPIGAEKQASWSLDKKDGDEKAYCCFNSNVRDFARIGQLILNKGNWNGKQIISEAYLDKALSPASHLMDKTGQEVDYYGYQWWLCNYDGLKIYYARGILGQYIIVIPSKNMVVVRLGHKRAKVKINNHPADLYEYIKLAILIASN